MKVPDEPNIVIYTKSSADETYTLSECRVDILKSLAELAPEIAAQPTLSALKVNISPILRSHCLYVPFMP